MAKRAWDPSKHPRDSRGRFTRSRTTLLTDAEAARVRGTGAGFTHKLFRSAAEQEAYLRDVPPRPQEQRDAIGAYTGGQSLDLNRALRTKKSLDPTQQVLADNLRAAMKPVDDDLVLTRTVSLAAFGDAPIEQLAGKKVKDAGFTSASLGLHYGGRRNNVTMRVSVPVGTPALFVGDDSGSPSDREVILPDGMEFAVVSASKNDRGGYDMHVVALPTQVKAEPGPADEYPVVNGRVALKDGSQVKVNETPSGKFELVIAGKNTPIEGVKTYASKSAALDAAPAAAAAYDARRAAPMRSQPGAKTFEELRAEKRAVADAAAAAEGARQAERDAEERRRANLATEAQVSYALDLIRRRIRSGEQGGFLNFSGGYPTAEKLRKMTRKQLSALIRDMKTAWG